LGIYLEFDDQGCGGYDCVDKCSIERESIKVDLKKQLGGLQNITGFDIILKIDDKSFIELSNFLKIVFKERLDDLKFVT